MYIYPDNLTSRAVLWLWELRDVAVVGIGCVASVNRYLFVGLSAGPVRAAASHCGHRRIRLPLHPGGGG